MARVPISQAGNIQAAPLTRERFQAADNRGGAVGGLGAGLQVLGAGLNEYSQNQERIDAQLDDAGFKTLSVKSITSFNQVLSGYTASRGMNAGRVRSDAEKAIQDASDGLMSEATTPRMRHMLELELSQRKAAAFAKIADHATTQMGVAEDDASIARRGALAEAAVAAATPAEREANMTAGIAEIAALGARRGLDPSVTTAETAKYKSGVYQSLIKNAIVADDIDGATAMIEAHKGDLLDADETQLRVMLKDPLERRDTNGYVGQIMGVATQEGAAFSYSDPLHGAGHTPVPGGKYGAGRDYGSHKGVDLPAPNGSPIYSTAPGVAKISTSKLGGTTITIDHGGGVVSRYMHLGKTDVKDGDRVTPDTIIGTVGTTGRSTGPHLHWEVLQNGKAVDPTALVGRAQQSPKRHDLNQLLAAVDADTTTTPEQKDRYKREIERRVGRDEELQQRVEQDATRRAYDAIDALPDRKLTSMDQLPADVRAALPSNARIELQGQIDRNIKKEAPTANGDIALVFNRMAAENPTQFVGLDLRAIRDQVTPGEFDTLFTTQGRLRANPTAPVGVDHGKIWGVINRAGPDVGIDGSKGASQGKRQAAQRVFSMVHADIEAVTGGKRNATDDEVQAAFDRAVREVKVSEPGAGLFGGTTERTARRYELQGPTANIPGTVRERITSQLRAAGRGPTEGAIAETYAKYRGRAGFW